MQIIGGNFIHLGSNNPSSEEVGRSNQLVSGSDHKEGGKEGGRKPKITFFRKLRKIVIFRGSDHKEGCDVRSSQLPQPNHTKVSRKTRNATFSKVKINRHF